MKTSIRSRALVQKLTACWPNMFSARHSEATFLPLSILKASGLRILDSGTADGCWLVVLAPQLRPQAQLVGTDLARQASECNLPPNYTFAIQNIKDEWPAHMTSRFDLVHQRFVLANVPERDAAVAALRCLVLPVKPRGWIQLDESSLPTEATSSSDSPFTTLLKVLGYFLSSIGLDPAPSKRVVALLEQAGKGLLGPVQIRESNVRFGRGAPSQEVAQAGIRTIMGLIDVVQPALAKLAKPPTSLEEFESLRTKCMEHLNTKGGDVVYTSVIAQRLG